VTQRANYKRLFGLRSISVETERINSLTKIFWNKTDILPKHLSFRNK
jgi:hypothetical protein